jgi:hypothetical protein
VTRTSRFSTIPSGYWIVELASCRDILVGDRAGLHSKLLWARCSRIEGLIIVTVVNWSADHGHPWISFQGCCQSSPHVHPLVHGSTCMVSAWCSPRWVAPSGGHHTYIFNGSFGLPRNLLGLSGRNSSNNMRKLCFNHFIKA